MKALLAVAACLCMGASEPTIRHSGVLNPDAPDALAQVAPPDRYMGDTAAVVIFSIQTVKDNCGDAALGCSGFSNGVPIIAAPNPCPLALRDLYAAILCHEIGHLNGWPATHGD
jgi:hypothetical protein